MKSNFFPPLSRKKIVVLFLATFFSVNQVNSGKGFEKCLFYNNDFTSYNSLVKFSFFDNNDINSGAVVNICCNESQCSLCSAGTSNFVCNRITQNVFCLGGGCAGIIGDVPIISNSTLGIGNCPDLSTIINYLKVTGVPKQFIGDEYAYFPPYSSCLNGFCTILNGCNWDNGGWTCYNYKNSNESCFLQWPAPFPSSSLISTSTSLLPTNPNKSGVFPNSKKIIISVGTTAGIVFIGGITYLIYKKRKNRNSKKSGDNTGLKALQEETKIKSLEEKIQIKKSERDQLLTTLQEKSNSKDTKIWLKDLLTTQKKDSNSPNLKEIKKLLESNEVDIDQVDQLCEIQKEIQELKKKTKKTEITEAEMINQIEIIPSTSHN
ncbi:MAG: hypothetical protein I3273_01010 [Candidatus Moeniiplasma glomeromycotorum]|nr:hypothetical protein [Candidatus Moeniiplasma glomeromycotorum]MCE8167299.1 hypothetical protein [Candidatus Moeniiplasma glomeromycotorum]MCE8168688.1 hypothetical protein [Candidatus Moeniiplasma glomeromycotorum]